MHRDLVSMLVKLNKHASIYLFLFFTAAFGSSANRRLLGAMSLVGVGDPDHFNCTPPAILDFPRDLFTDYQRQHGAALCHALVALYLFILLAIVCDKYFVPCIEKTIESKNNKNYFLLKSVLRKKKSTPLL